MLASNRVDVSRTNATFFTSDEISGDRVVYKHDDSESRRDTFHFVATAASGGGLSSGGTSIGMTTDHALPNHFLFLFAKVILIFNANLDLWEMIKLSKISKIFIIMIPFKCTLI